MWGDLYGSPQENHEMKMISSGEHADGDFCEGSYERT